MRSWFRRRRADQAADAQWREVQDEADQGRQARQRLLAGQRDLVASLEDVLFRHDPIGINFEHNTDEYRPEAETIALRLPDAATELDVQRIVHQEFIRWFGGDTAGTVNVVLRPPERSG